jgi:hypothetical protein
MRKPDEIVREVVCNETGKPMAKIPLWMADVKVKFISDEARQKHPALPSLADIEPLRRASSSADPDALKVIESKGIAAIDDPDAGFDDVEVEEAEDEDDD